MKKAKYQLILNDIIEKINNKELRKGDKLPTEFMLQEIYNASRHSVRVALEALTKRGYVKTIRGSGNYILNESAFRIFDIDMLEKIVGSDIKTKVISFKKIEPDKQIQKNLQVCANEEILVWERLRIKDDIPFQIGTTYVPFSMFPEIKSNDLRFSFYKYVEKKMGYQISYAIKKVDAINIGKEAEYLQIPKGTAVLYISQIGYLSTGSIFEYSETMQYNTPFMHYSTKI